MKNKPAPRIRATRSTGATGGSRVLMDSNPCTEYSSRPDATSEAEAETLVAVYRSILFECHEGEAVGAASDTEETEEGRLAG